MMVKVETRMAHITICCGIPLNNCQMESSTATITQLVEAVTGV